MSLAFEDGAPPAKSRRPRRPRPSLFILLSAPLAVLFTLATALDWRYGTGFSLRTIFTDLGRRNPVMEALRDADLDQIFSPRSRRAFVDTLRVAVLATIAGSAVSLPLALLSTRLGAPWLWLRSLMRTTSSIIRSIPDLLWAVLFVAAVGVGLLAGLLALFCFTIAVVTKLTADTLDGIDHGPIEAAEASGAGHSQMLRAAAIPQVLPAYTSFVLYAFELNVRASAVLGLVGAGGIGARIGLFENQNNWEALWGLVVMFVAVVFVLDRISLALRKRLV